MSNYSIYFSPTGGTKKVADHLAHGLFDQWQEIDLCEEIAPLQLGAEDVCIVSVPSYGGRVPACAIARLGKLSGCGARAVLNCVYGNRAWEDTLTELQDTLEAQGFVCSAAVAAVAEHSIFRQFASGRPDADDARELADFARKIGEKLKSGKRRPLLLAGSHGDYKVYRGSSFWPKGDERCTGCGLCAEKCPAGAIDTAKPWETDTDRCISCMRCIRICPRQARSLDAELMSAMGEKMAAMLGGHKENYLFL